MYSLQEFIISISVFINSVLIPFILALALLFFLYNTTRYFIIGGEKEHEKAKNTAIYSIAAFVLIVSIWGIVNLLISGLGFNQKRAVMPDYIWNFNSSFYRDSINQ